MRLRWGTLLVRHLVSTVRRISSDKAYSITTILGLSVAFLVLSICLNVAEHELGVDSFHVNGDRIYRVVQAGGEARHGRSIFYHLTPNSLAGRLSDEFPELETSCQIIETTSFIKLPDGGQAEVQALFTKGAFAQMFSFGIADITIGAGDALISEELAARLSKDGGLPGSVEVVSGGHTSRMRVVGTIPPVPKRSSMKPEIVLSLESTASPFRQSLEADTPIVNTFVMLRAQAVMAEVQSRLSGTRPVLDESGSYNHLMLQSLQGVYFDSTIGGNKGTMLLPIVLLSFGGIVLILVCANFANLLVATAGERRREMTIRIALGASHSDVIAQVVCEVFVYVLLSAIIGVSLSAIVLPEVANEFTLDTEVVWSSEFLLHIALAVVVATALAALYPAALGLRRRLWHVRDHTLRRKRLGDVLIAIQFATGTIALASSITIDGQFRYMLQRDPGYPSRDIALIELDDAEMDARSVADRVRSVTSSWKTVRGVSGCSAFFHGVPWEMADRHVAPGYVRLIEADRHIVDVLNLKVLAGRLPLSSVGRQLLVSEVTRTAFSLEQGVGAVLPDLAGGLAVQAVFGNVDYRPADDEQEPLAVILDPDLEPKVLLIRAETGRLGAVLRRLEATWDEIAPGHPFKARSISDLERLEQLPSEKVAMFSLLMAGVSLSIGLLGVFAVVTRMVDVRTGEIAVRKTLGSTSYGVLSLIVRDALRSLTGGIAAGAVISWGLMRELLSQFAAQMPLGPQPFIFASCVTFLFAVIVAVARAQRLAWMSPSAGLRTSGG